MTVVGLVLSAERGNPLPRTAKNSYPTLYVFEYNIKNVSSIPCQVKTSESPDDRVDCLFLMSGMEIRKWSCLRGFIN